MKYWTALWLVLGLPLSSRAWNAEGHMVVAQLAYNHLNATARARCDALIAVPLANGSSANNIFATAACWADDYKSQLGTSIWHYIDLPFSLDGTSTSGVTTAAFDVVQAIRQCVVTLQDTNAPAVDQATALRYLLHFVGDIQQPLHCSTAVSAGSLGGDAGGNSYTLNGGTWSNLHSLWDAGGGFLTNSVSRPLSASGQTTLNNKVAVIEADYPYAANLGTIPDPLDWADEGWSIAQTVCYVGIARNTAPSVAYLATAQATTEQRMAVGGHRLADLLTTLFAATPPNLTALAVANGNISFSWPATAGKTYRVQWTQQLASPTWNDLPDMVATGNSLSFTNTIVPPLRFYRVLVVN